MTPITTASPTIVRTIEPPPAPTCVACGPAPVRSTGVDSPPRAPRAGAATSSTAAAPSAAARGSRVTVGIEGATPRERVAPGDRQGAVGLERRTGTVAAMPRYAAFLRG